MVFNLALFSCLKYRIYKQRPAPALPLIFTSVCSSVIPYFCCISHRNESPELHCGAGTVGGDMGSTHRAKASVRLPRGGGGCSGGAGLPQRPAPSWLQVCTEPDRRHQGLREGKSAGGGAV